MIQRWGFKGLGMVQDPLEPRVDFITLQWVWAQQFSALNH
jgi:hypothetical protein